MAKKANGKAADPPEEVTEVVAKMDVEAVEAHPFAATAKAPEGFVELPVGKVIIDQEWNSRRERTSPGEGDKKKTAEGEEWPDEKLEASIRARLSAGLSPFLQEPTVEKLKNGDYRVVYGFRRTITAVRIDPKMVARFKVRATTGDAKRDDLSARLDNLTENVQRVDLRPWELAEQLHRTKTHHPEVSTKQIADATGLSDRYVSNLLRFRRKICDQLWQEYQLKGESMRIQDLLKVCAKPEDEQVEAYNAILRGEDGDGDKEKKKTKGAKYKTWLRQVEKQLGKENSRDREKYLKGMAYVLQCVTGADEWQNPAVVERTRSAET